MYNNILNSCAFFWPYVDVRYTAEALIIGIDVVDLDFDAVRREIIRLLVSIGYIVAWVDAMGTTLQRATGETIVITTLYNIDLF